MILLHVWHIGFSVAFSGVYGADTFPPLCKAFGMEISKA